MMIFDAIFKTTIYFTEQKSKEKDVRQKTHKFLPKYYLPKKKVSIVDMSVISVWHYLIC